MKIAFISLMGGVSWGGSEALWSKTAELALEQGHKVFVSVYRVDKVADPIKKLNEKGAYIHFRERYNPNQSFGKKLKNYLQVHFLKKSSAYRKLWSFKPDHIFISQGNNFDIAVHHYDLYEKINKYKIPYSLVCHSHCQFSFIPQSNIYPRAKDIFLNARKVFFISDRQKKVTEKALLTKLSNAEFSWNPLNLKDYKYIEWPGGGTIQFAVVGGLISGKGLDVLIEILSQERWKDRNWHLNIYGKGYGEKYLKDLVKWYGVDGRITFHGHVNNITEVWEKNHILLIPSSGEGLPISLCEAMICGRPAVVTDVGGHSEIIAENETGFIADAPTVTSFLNALERAWENRRSWGRMGEKSSKFAMNKIDLIPEKTLLNSIINSKVN